MNGLSPYLGLKTHNTCTMFSNLQVEGGRTNHLFMPAWQPFGYLRDGVLIVDSDLPCIREFHSFVPLCRNSLGALADKNGFEKVLHVNSSSGSHGGGSQCILPYCIQYLQLRALVWQAATDGASFFVEYSRPEPVQLRGGEEMLLGAEPLRLVVSDGLVQEGDERLARAAPVSRRLCFSRTGGPSLHTETFARRVLWRLV